MITIMTSRMRWQEQKQGEEKKDEECEKDKDCNDDIDNFIIVSCPVNKVFITNAGSFFFFFFFF